MGELKKEIKKELAAEGLDDEEGDGSPTFGGLKKKTEVEDFSVRKKVPQGKDGMSQAGFMQLAKEKKGPTSKEDFKLITIEEVY